MRRAVVVAAIVITSVVCLSAQRAKPPAKAPAPQPASATAPAAPKVDRFAGLKARSIGPAGMSGRVAAVEGVASDPNTLYVGAATGGVWKSIDGGATWNPIFDDQPVHAIGAIAVNPSNPNIVWVGTGEGNVRNSASIGNGMYRSLDAGRTWQHVGLDATERIFKIALDRNSQDTAYACALGHLWGENPERGVFKTTDGGKSWSRILYVDEKTGCGDLVMDPTNANKLFASMWQFRRWPYFFKSGGPGSALYVTSDGGASWKKLQEEDGLPKAPYGRIGVDVSRSNPEVVYAMVEAEKSAFLRSDDGGLHWKTMNSKPNVDPRPFYFGDIRVDPARPDRVYTIDYEIRVTDDAGKTFQTLPGASWSQLHGDYHALWINPSNPEFIIVGDDGGAAISRNRGKTFRFAQNLPLAQYYHVAVDNELPYNIYGGLQDNGSWRGPSDVWRRGGIRNYDWAEIGGGDGFEALPLATDASVGYSEWQGGNILRWNLRTGEEKALRPAAPQGVKLRFNWNAGLATDPFDPDTVYLGSQFVHKSADRGETWTTISPDLTTNNPEWQKFDESGGLTRDVSGAETYTTIISIAPSAKERGLLWVGTDDGRVQITRDGGKTWTSLEKNFTGVPANSWVPHIEASPIDPATAFVVFDNHRRNDPKPYAYRTGDYGKTWQSLIGGDTVSGYALVLRQDPVDKDLLFLGTEFGLYFSSDGGRRWTQLKKTLPTASVMDLAIQPRAHDLVIGTHGRALYVLDDIRPLRAMTEQALNEPLKLYDIGDAQQHWTRNEEGGFGYGAAEFRGKTRPYGAILTYSMNLPNLPLQDEELERARKEKAREEQLQQEAPRREPSMKGEEEPKAPAAPKGAAAVQRPSTAETPGEAKKEEKKAEEKKAIEEKPQVEVTVANASGQIIRHFKVPAMFGVNRAAWDLTRDAFKQPPRPEDAPPAEPDPGGPEVPPGTYTVTLKYQAYEAKAPVRVLADPRSKNTPQDWQRRWDAIARAGALNDAGVEAIRRIRSTRADVATIQQKVRQRAQDAGERDQKKINENPVIEAGDKLVEKLNAFEKQLWQSPEAVGIQAETDVFSDIWRAGGSIMSSWDPPNANQAEYMKAAEARVSTFLDELNKFFAADVARFKKQAADANVGLIGDTEELKVKR